MLYYGDKISPNMVKTPEGYLICKNVPIGRVGTMDYLGSELPQEFNLPANDIFHVFRTADSLFSKETIASFEGKPITDNHPTNNLTVDTASIIGRGHLQNVHPEGKNLVGDLYITDNGLINQIENNNKREVSCGYDAGWRMNEDGKIEQIDIVGNHVAVVNSGRAGHSVAIKDSSPEIKKNIGGKKMTITKKMLTALGLKHFAADAEPEEIAKAMDAMGGEEAPQKTTVTKDDDMAVQNKDPEQKVDPLVEVNAKIDKLASIISALVESDKKVHEEAGAKEAFDELEGELSEPEDEETLKDEEEETPEMQEEEKNTGEEKHEFVADEEAVKKIVKDMKPIIMNIKDKIVRDAVAKEFVKTVRDSRPSTGRNGYSQIIKNANASRKVAQDKATMPAVGNLYKATDAATAWANYGKTLSKGDK
jgi:hypothetical protein